MSTTGHVAPRRDTTAQDLAAELGVDPGSLRKWLRRNAPQHVASRRRPGGGNLLLVTTEGQEAARAHYHVATRHDAEPMRRGVLSAMPQDQPDTSRHVATRDGWEAACSLLRSELDRALAERDVARVEAQAARREAEEAVRGQAATVARLESLRAAWWRWRVLLDALGPLARLRRRWPAEPAELTADRLLTAPKG